MKKFKVKGGMGRLAQFPKEIVIEAKDEKQAYGIAMNEIRRQVELMAKVHGASEGADHLTKIVNITSIEEI